jgi:hypothetical protein
LVATISHSGGMSAGHYVAYCFHHQQNAWYLFDDSRVTRVPLSHVLAAESYLLFYQKSNQILTQERAIVNQLITSFETAGDEADRRYICSKWLFNWRHIGEPGPIANHAWSCVHGNVLEGIFSKIDAHVSIIPAEAWQLLHARYGGGPEIRTLQICPECSRLRDEESKTVAKLEANNSAYTGVWFLIATVWLQSWRAWIKGLGPRPGPMDNRVFFAPNGSLQNNLVVAKDYRGLNLHTWYFFEEVYGGGPPVCRSRIDIYAPEVPIPSRDASPSSL